MRTLLLLLPSLLGSVQGALAASDVRFSEIDPFANTVIIKNYGDTTEVIDSWLLSSRGTTFGITGDPRVSTFSGSTALEPGAEVKLAILDNPDFLARQNDDLALHRGTPLSDPASMVDYLVWGNAGGFRESVAASAGIWQIGDFVELGEVISYTGNGSDTGPRVGVWTAKQTNVRLLSVDPGNNRFSVKNFDTTPVDINEWVFTIGNFSLSIAVNPDLSSPTGVTVLGPGDALTLEVGPGVLVNPAGSAIGVYRSEIPLHIAGGMADFVQWIVDNNIREPVANTNGIWSVDATLEVAPVYTYDGNGSDTGPREAWWNTGGVLPPGPIDVSFSFGPGGLPTIAFTTTSGRLYQVQHSADLTTWTPLGSAITGTGSIIAEQDAGATGIVRRFYRVVDVTP